MFACFPKKHHLGSQNDSGSSRPKKIPKIKTIEIENYAKIRKLKGNNVGGPSGIGGWPPISTLIILINQCS